MKKSLSFLSLVSSFFFTTSVFAAARLDDAKGFLDQTAGVNGAGYTESDIGSFTGTIINVALSLVGIIFLGLTVYAGYLWMTAQGEDSQIEKSKKILSSSIIGLVLTLGAYAITALITTRFGG